MEKRCFLNESSGSLLSNCCICSFVNCGKLRRREHLNVTLRDSTERTRATRGNSSDTCCSGETQKPVETTHVTLISGWT